jgi:hypothetical protein
MIMFLEDSEQSCRQGSSIESLYFVVHMDVAEAETDSARPVACAIAYAHVLGDKFAKR